MHVIDVKYLQRSILLQGTGEQSKTKQVIPAYKLWWIVETKYYNFVVYCDHLTVPRDPLLTKYFVYSFLPSIFAIKKITTLPTTLRLLTTQHLSYYKTLKFHCQLNVSEISFLDIVLCVYLLLSNQLGAMSTKALHRADDLTDFGQAQYL